MNLVGRQDRLLLVGLAVAVVVIFAQPIRQLIDLARDVERTSGLALTPALLILVVVFFVHQQGKRLEEKARAASARAEALQAQSRASEMERLVSFGHALGRSLDLEAIRDVVVHQLPTLAGSEEAWVLVRSEGHWRILTAAPAPTTSRELNDAIDATRRDIAERAVSSEASGWVADPLAGDGDHCVTMTAAGQVLGVLGVPRSSGPFDDSRRRTLDAAAALLAISIRNAQLFKEVRENSLRDALTGCFNRAHARDVIDTELRRARRSQSPMSLIMFDLDHFKDINDHYGHLCGDAVLAAVGARMRDVLRGSDLKCRYGGEEFLVLLPETPLDGARRVAETLRREIGDMLIHWKDESLRITASFGVSVALPSEVDVDAVIGRADQALYRAKDQGRNCVRLATEPALV